MPESYTGNEGDDALDAGLDVMDGGEKWAGANGGWRAINKTRDMIVWALNQAKAYADSLFGSISLSWSAISGKPSSFPPSAHNHIRLTGPAGEAFGWSTGSGGWDAGHATFLRSHLYNTMGRATPVTTSYVVAYLNGDGRLGATPSAAKYKHDIADYDGSALGLRAVTYVLNDDPKGTVRLGVVADEANGVEPMLVVHENGEVESFKYELLAVALLRDVQRLAARVAELEAAQ